MRCDKCRGRAIIFQQYSGLHLCGQHFVADFEAKAKRAIRTHRWMKGNDHIGVALSGRTDSSALLYFLNLLASGRRDITLSAITIDEGIRNYSDPSRAEHIARSLGVTCAVASFRDEYGIGMDEIVARQGEACPCSYCRVLRRSLLNRIAREEGITKLALGLNLDDGAQSVLMNVVQGDADRLLHTPGEVAGMVPVIRPFMFIPEREVTYYARLHLEKPGPERCPYAHDALRDDVRSVLNDYTLRHPSTKHSLVSMGEHLAKAGRVAGLEIPTCEQCGEPCSGACPGCRILMEVQRSAA